MSPSPEQMRIVIAEKCGWTGPFEMYKSIASGKQLLSTRESILHGTPPEDKGKSEEDCAYLPVPNYLCDLNAMHEAEKMLCYFQKEDITGRYINELNKLCNKQTVDWIQPLLIWNMYHATALQRAEAFCRTVKPEMFE